MNTTLKKLDPILFSPWFWTVIIGCLYWALHLRFRLDNLDDAWVQSWSYGFWKNGTVDDLVFGSDSPAQGLRLFGRTYSFVYGPILLLVGWTKSHSHLISTFLIMASVFCFFFGLKRLKTPERLAFTIVAPIPIIEAFFSAANQARTDALVFFFCSLVFLLATQQRWFWGTLFAFLAIEIHPAGFFAFLYGAGAGTGLSISSAQSLKKRHLLESFKKTSLAALPWALVGTAVGSGYYLSLHYPYLPGLSSISDRNSVSGEVDNFLFHYFFLTKYYRHVPEFVIFLASVGVLIWKAKRKTLHLEPSTIGLIGLSVLLLAGTLIIRRPNFHYTLFAYPGILILLSITARSLRAEGGLLLLLLALFLPQYGYVFYKQRSYDHDALISQLKKAVPPETAMIVGCSDCWFAFKDRNFHHYRFGRLDKLGDEFVVVEDDRFRSDFKHRYDKQYSRKSLKTFKVGPKRFDLTLRTRLE